MHDDPRVTGDHVRRLPATPDGQRVILVGVVHDHPASTYRATQVVREARPDVLALELPPLAVPLFEAYARDERTPPAFGGEMSAAIQIAGTARAVGVDGPSLRFVRHLLAAVVDGRHSPGAAASLCRSLGSVTKHAAVCRLASILARQTGLRVEVDQPVEHEVDRSDDPAEQARDERSEIQAARTVMDVFQPAAASAARKPLREGHMAEQLSRLRREGEVVAIVGIGHLDALTTRLRAEEP